MKRLHKLYRKQHPNTVITIKDDYHIIFYETIRNQDITENSVGIPFVDNGEVMFEPKITLLEYYNNYYPYAIRCDCNKILKITVNLDRSGYPSNFYREWQTGITEFTNLFIINSLSKCMKTML